jgi:hypothetical protein
MILADIQPEETNNTRRKIRSLTGDLDLEYDVVTYLCMVCSANFHKYSDAVPLYMNIQKDGAELYA